MVNSWVGLATWQGYVYRTQKIVPDIVHDRMLPQNPSPYGITLNVSTVISSVWRLRKPETHAEL
jgi:hypothetical protein